MHRRTFLTLAVAPILPAMSRRGIQAGDWIKVVALPEWTAAWASRNDPHCRMCAWAFQQTLGNTYQVLYVSEGKAAVDLGPEVAQAMGTLIAPIELEPALIVRVPAPRQERRNASEKLRATLKRYEELDALPSGPIQQAALLD